MKKLTLVLAIVLLVSLMATPLCSVSASEETDFASVFASYVAEKGNKVSEEGLLEAIKAIDANATIDDIFIKYAVDGVYDEDEDYPLSIPGNDGYVAVVATVNGAKVDATAKIPHVEENLGTLTVEVFTPDNTNFVYDTNTSYTSKKYYRIYKYTGNAQKLVFPAEAGSGIAYDILWGQTGQGSARQVPPNKDNVVAVMIEDGGHASDDFRLFSNSFNGWASLKALSLPEGRVMGAITDAAVMNNPNLKYVRLPKGLSIPSGYGSIGAGSFQHNPVLENCRASNGLMTSCRFGGYAFKGTNIREFYLHPSTQIANNDVDGNFNNSMKHGLSSSVVLTSAEWGNPDLTHAAVLAMIAWDNHNGSVAKDDLKAALDASYTTGDYTSAVTSSWDAASTFEADKIDATYILSDGSNTVSLKITRNNAQAIDGLSLPNLTMPTFDPTITTYAVSVPFDAEELPVEVKLAYGATLVSITGNTGLTAGEDGSIVIKAMAANGTEQTYTINFTRIRPLTFAQKVELAKEALNALTVNNNTTKEDVQAAIDAALTGQGCTVTLDFYLQKAIGGAKEGETVLVEGVKGYMGAIVKVSNGTDAETFTSLKEIAPEMENFTFASVSKAEDFDISEDGKTLLAYTGTAEKIVFPEGIERLDDIWYYSREPESSVRAMIFPDSLTYLPRDLCYNMKNLEVVYMGDNITESSSSWFYGCFSLKYVRLSRSLENLAYGMFRGTASLVSVYIPDSVKTIDANIFDLSLARDITIPAGVEKIYNNCFAYPLVNTSVLITKDLTTDTELMEKLQKNIVDQYASSRRQITFLGDKIPDLGTWMFSTDTSGGWGYFDVYAPAGSDISKYLNENYADLLVNGCIKLTTDKMGTAEAAVRAQMRANYASLTEGSTAEQAMKNIASSYYADNITLTWKENYAATNGRGTGVLTLKDANDVAFDIVLDVELLTAIVADDDSDFDNDDDNSDDNSNEDDKDSGNGGSNSEDANKGENVDDNTTSPITGVGMPLIAMLVLVTSSAVLMVVRRRRA